jgi:hypothetical protein
MGEIIVHTLIGSAFSAAFFGLYATLGTTGQIVQRVVLLRTPAWKRFYQKKEIDRGPKQSQGSCISSPRAYNQLTKFHFC